jgi:hypothetical protein
MIRNNIFFAITLMVIISHEGYAQSKSAIQFYDSTGAAKTGKIGWTGDATNGHFFVQTPSNGEVLKSNSNGIEVTGTFSANRIIGDGSELTNLPSPSVSIKNVDGLQDSLSKKATTADLTALQSQNAVKADTNWVKGRIGIMADTPWVTGKLGNKSDTSWVNGKLSPKADTTFVNTKIADIGSLPIADGSVTSSKISASAVDSGKVKDGSLSGADLNPTAKLSIAGLTSTGKVSIAGGPGPALDVTSTEPTVMRLTAPAFNNVQLRFAGKKDGELWAIGADIPQGNGSKDFHFFDLPGNTARLTIQQGTGNVGIGTINPVTTFHVKRQDGNPLAQFETSLNNGNGWIQISNPAYNYLLGLRGDEENNFTIYDNIKNFDRFSITPTGNVGIGIPNPAAFVHIFGNTNCEIARFQPASDARDSRGFISLYTTNPNYWWEISNQDISGGGRTNGLAFRERTGSGNSIERVYFSQGGNVGIGTLSPSYALDVNGTIRGNNVAPSDRRFKTSIAPLSSSLEKVSSLQGVSYQWDCAKWPKKNFSEGKQIGLIAQDVEKVVPEVVTTDKEGYKSLAYDRLVAVLIEAVKEQQKEIVALRQDLETVKAKAGLK